MAGKRPVLQKIGDRFHRLIIVAPAPPTKRGKTQWEVQCDCGTIKTVEQRSLRNGHTQSCGCLQREHIRMLGWDSRKHGEAQRGTVEYRAWNSMLRRCYNPRSKGYKYWGGRGIEVCPEWRESFVAFLESVGRRPTSEHALDRIDNNGDYRPGNVRWATKKQQARNRRSPATPWDTRARKLNPDLAREIRKLYAAGENQKSIADKFGICQATVSEIVRGRIWKEGKKSKRTPYKRKKSKRTPYKRKGEHI